MKIVKDSRELPLASAFVPTMGALHDGHGSLFAKAGELSESVVASIFLNPLQFESKLDLDKYPQTPERDIEVAQRYGVTHLYLPNEGDIYPSGYMKLLAGSLGNIYEGASRPGHFDGVVTVVRRLFDLVRPKWAVFGEKDFQQLALVRAIAGEVEIVAAPTIRESSGLAMSSRNARLTPQERTAASIIFKALSLGKSAEEIREILASEPLFTLDYAELIDEETFLAPNEGSLSVRAIVAGWINSVRLIDNMAMKKAQL